MGADVEEHLLGGLLLAEADVLPFGYELVGLQNYSSVRVGRRMMLCMLP